MSWFRRFVKQVFCFHSSWAKAGWMPYFALYNQNYYVCKECGTIRNFGFEVPRAPGITFAIPRMPINFDCSSDTWYSPGGRFKTPSDKEGARVSEVQFCNFCRVPTVTRDSDCVNCGLSKPHTDADIRKKMEDELMRTQTELTDLQGGYIQLRTELAALKKDNGYLQALHDDVERERDALKAEVERLKKICNGYKAWGSDACPKCETGRVTLFIWNDRCISCEPESYK